MDPEAIHSMSNDVNSQIINNSSYMSAGKCYVSGRNRKEREEIKIVKGAKLTEVLVPPFQLPTSWKKGQMKG